MYTMCVQEPEVGPLELGGCEATSEFSSKHSTSEPSLQPQFLHLWEKLIRQDNV